MTNGFYQTLRLLLLTGFFVGCRSEEKKDPLLEEAARYHQQATVIQAIVEPKIERIDSLKTVLLAQKKPVVQATIATLDSLKMAFVEWEENLVEVPGMPHNHNHNHGEHAHKHARNAGPDATLKDLPADQMRDLQREILNNIRQIQARLKQVAP